MKLKERRKTQPHLLKEVGVVRVVIRLMDTEAKRQRVSRSFTVHDTSVNEVYDICHKSIENAVKGD